MTELTPTNIDILTEALKPFMVLSLGMFKKESDIRCYIISNLQHAQDIEVKDLVAFVMFSAKHKRRSSWIASNLAHDISGIGKPEPCFSPRTSGYHEVWKSGK